MATVENDKRKSLNLSTAIEKIYGLKTDNETDKMLHVLSSTFTEMLDFDFFDLLEVNPDDFIARISQFKYSCSFLDSIALLIYEGAEFFRLTNKSTNALHLDKIRLALLKHLSITDKTYSAQREETIARLESIL